MSLIYHALSRLEKKIENGMQSSLSHISTDQYVLASQRSGMPQWVKALFVVCIVGIVAGLVAMSMLRNQLNHLQTQVMASPASMSASASAVVNVPVAAADVVAPVVPAAKHQAVQDINLAEARPESQSELKQMPTASAEESKPSQATTQAESAASQASIVEIRVESGMSALESKKGRRESAKENSKKLSVAKSDAASTVKRVANEDKANQDVAILIASVKTAIQTGRKADADNLIVQLQTKLDPDSLTLIHLKAWRQMQGGDANLAMNLYLHILNRNPEDEVAAINLALLQWRGGQQVEARKTIAAIYARKPESEQLQAYARQFGVQQ
ncbi:MAG: hypothetical protein HY253_07365 [Burkholderiales bacterium]|nr:hypothetical protein [Burkholderiales bacterium]